MTSSKRDLLGAPSLLDAHALRVLLGLMYRSGYLHGQRAGVLQAAARVDTIDDSWWQTLLGEIERHSDPVLREE